MSIVDLFKQKKPGPKKQAKLKVKTKPKTAKPPEDKIKKGKRLGKAYRVLIKPLITEKATDLAVQNKYVFKIAMNATKQEVKRAIEDVYRVKPQAIHTIRVHGKQKRYGKTKGRTSGWKKAVVTLRPGKKLEIVEGV